MDNFLHNLFGGGGRGNGGNGGAGRGGGNSGYPGAAYAAGRGGGRGNGGRGGGGGAPPNGSDMQRILQELAAAAAMGMGAGGGGGGGGGVGYYPGHGFVGFDNDGWEVPPEGWLREEHDRPVGPPPTSRRALARLPEVVMAEADLAVDTNHECAVCMEPHTLGGKAMKLPCQHCFHKECVLSWLEKHNTCPTCRFELETDDQAYEQERRKRMEGRRIRLRRGDLERKGVGELKRLLEQLGVPTAGCLEKSDMVQRLLASGFIEEIVDPSPAPADDSQATTGGQQQQQQQQQEEEEEEAGMDSKLPPPPPPPPSASEASSSAAASGGGEGADDDDELDRLTVGELRAMMARLAVRDAGCLERRDLVQALRASGRLPPPSSSAMGGGGTGR